MEEKLSGRSQQQRFEKLIKVALNTKPKPIKSMAPKGVPWLFATYPNHDISVAGKQGGGDTPVLARADLFICALGRDCG